MEWMIGLAALVASLVGAASAYFSFKLRYKQEREKDVLWETALALTRNQNGNKRDVRDFAEIYLTLKAFKENPDKVPDVEKIIDRSHGFFRNQDD